MNNMNHAFSLRVRNVNHALADLFKMLERYPTRWRSVAPRGMQTLEYRGLWVTEYTNPTERVLFETARDAHPFFHFMEALWIMAGRRDVEWISYYLSNIRKYSDDGIVFNASYGYRIRHHFGRDQLLEVINHLQQDNDSRRAVIGLWDPLRDLNLESKDLPCNDLITFKVRDGKLDITVMCRSNDAIWGAYGANAVQFSFIQEFIARALRLKCGTYCQVSDSLHVYTDNEIYKRLKSNIFTVDPYSNSDNALTPYPILQDGEDHHLWLAALRLFMDSNNYGHGIPFFEYVAIPIAEAWKCYKENKGSRQSIDASIATLKKDCRAPDWRRACIEWLERKYE
jgi:hypothetical protein